MKKLFLISFICLATTAISFAQLKIVPSGRVGIGITSPSTKLHVKDASPFVTLENTVSPFKIWQMGINGSDFLIAEASTTRFFIQNSTGNVGINDNTPLALFTVGNGDLFRVTSSGYVQSISGAQGTPTYSFTGSNNTGMFSSAAGVLNFSTSGAEKMRILSNGFVGIGTTVATNILSLGGTAARTIWMERNTTAGTAGQGLTLFSGGAYSGGTNLAGGDLTVKSGTSTGTGTSALHFYTATAGSSGTTDNAPTEKMTILGNGNVGLGTLSPNTKLELNATTSGGLKINQSYNGVGLTIDATPVTYVYNFGLVTNMLSTTSKAIVVEQSGTEKVWITPHGININAWDEAYNLSVTGNTYCTAGVWSASDMQYKQNVTTIDSPIDKLNQISGKKYEYNTTAFPNKNFPSGYTYGVIAQEIQSVLPELVKADSLGYLAVNYDGLIPILIEAVKQQNATITQQGEQIILLEKMIQDCCKAVTPGTINGK